MKKRNEIILGIFLVIVGSTLLIAQVLLNSYRVPNFQGGLNLLDDPTNIAPNEALLMTNLDLISPNVAKSRRGYSYLDSVAVNTNQEIDEIYIYEPYSGTKRLVFATNGRIFIAPSLADPGAVDWDTLAIGWDGDSLIVTNGSASVTDLGNNWWYTKMVSRVESTARDTIDIEGTKYGIGVHELSHNLALLGTAYSGSTDTLTYTVYKGTKGIVTFIQEGEKLYICDSELHPLVYDDTGFVFIALIDSGLVTDTTELTGYDSYNHGKVHLDNDYGQIWNGDSSITETSWDSSWVGRLFSVPVNLGHGTWDWTATIDRMILISDSSGWRLRTVERFPSNWESYLPFWNNYEIKEALANCVEDSGYAVEDSNKNWLDQTYGTGFLESFYAIDGDAGYSPGTLPSSIRRVYCNETETFSIPWLDTMTFGIAEPYYIFSRVPFRLSELDTTYKEYPRFEQIFFYNNQLYGFGFDRDGYSPRAEHNYNRLWYSDVAQSVGAATMHRHIKPFYNFDVGLADNISVGFRLRGRSYVAANNSIWTFTGIPTTLPSLSLRTYGDLYLEKVISNNGIPDIDNWAKATEEYGYLANRTGVYRFNGTRAKKISWDIDPIIQANYGSRIVMGYFPVEQKLFLSFPDSNVTYFYDERFPDDTWVGPWDFGMTCFYAPPDTNIFYFGHSEFKGRIYYYPNELYQDIIAIDDTNDISVVYESGWQSLADGPWISKRLLTGYFPVQSAGVFSVDIYSDFGAAAVDTFTSAGSGNRAFRIDNLSAVGDYFKFKITASAGENIIIRPYRIDWQEADMKEGD